MRISDWSSDVCSSDLRAFQKRDEILLAFKLVQKLPDALQIGHRALIQQMSLSAHDQHRPLVAILRPCGKALCDDMLRGAVDRCAALADLGFKLLRRLLEDRQSRRLNSSP